mmetsp:Transcript_19733/g.48264  ORF Transcript_19733/g.48264 Transcript_19733/m.48264 type:complete len:121 (+) Transcript_19733:94-456(+)
MGACLSDDADAGRLSLVGGGDLAAEIKRNKMLEKQLTMEAKQGRLHHKLLLLGAGESGKSTFFKQLIRIHDNGYDLNSRKGFEHSIYKNIINSMHNLLVALDMSQMKLDEKKREIPTDFH